MLRCVWPGDHSGAESDSGSMFESADAVRSIVARSPGAISAPVSYYDDWHSKEEDENAVGADVCNSNDCVECFAEAVSAILRSEWAVWPVLHSQELSSSSGGVGVHITERQIVSRQDVVCGNSDDSREGGASDSESSEWISRRIKMQLRDVDDNVRNEVFVWTSDDCPASLAARPPSDASSISVDSVRFKCGGDEFVRGHLDEELMHWYHPQFNRNSAGVLANASMFNKWPGRKFRSRKKYSTVWDTVGYAVLRNIKVGLPVLRGRWPIGHVDRHLSRTYIHNLDGRRTGVSGAVTRVEHGHHVGTNHAYHGAPPPLPSCCRIV